MATLRIPDDYQAGLACILKLADASVSQLAEAIRQAPPTAKLPEIISVVAPEVPDLSGEQLSDILATLFSLYIVRGQADVSLKRFVDDLIEAMRATGRDDLMVPPEQSSAIKERLARLLDIEPLNTFSKAVGLRGDHQRTFCDARILTDLRPVFGQDPSAPPVGAVIVHNLKLEYHESGDHKEFFLALDSDDIETLIEALERARIKSKSLQSLLSVTKLSEMGQV